MSSDAKKVIFVLTGIAAYAWVVSLALTKVPDEWGQSAAIMLPLIISLLIGGVISMIMICHIPSSFGKPMSKIPFIVIAYLLGAIVTYGYEYNNTCEKSGSCAYSLAVLWPISEPAKLSVWLFKKV